MAQSIALDNQSCCMAEQKIGGYSTKYRYTGKELDPMTGLSYFGARYYDPRLSVWFGVDPLAEKIPNHSAYNYVYNNPIRFLDQQGLYGEEGEATKAQEAAVAKYGKDRVGDVYFNKDKNEFAFQIYGEGKDKYEHNDNEGAVAYKPDVSVYNNEQYDAYSNNSNYSTLNNLDQVAGSIGVNTDLKEGMFKAAKQSGEIGASAEKYLKFTKGLGVATGAIGIGIAGKKLYDNPTAGNSIRLAVQGLAVGSAFIPVGGWAVSLGIGAADLFWGDKFYQWIDNHNKKK